MSLFGNYISSWAMNLVSDANGDQVTTTQTTTSPALEDIPGLTFDLILPAAGRILAIMTVESKRDGPTATVGAWAISINGVDGQEKQRQFPTNGSPGSCTVMAFASLAAGPYTVKGRHRRVSGTSDVDTDISQLLAIAVVS